MPSNERLTNNGNRVNKDNPALSIIDITKGEEEALKALKEAGKISQDLNEEWLKNKKCYEPPNNNWKKPIITKGDDLLKDDHE